VNQDLLNTLTQVILKASETEEGYQNFMSTLHLMNPLLINTLADAAAQDGILKRPVTSNQGTNPLLNLLFNQPLNRNSDAVSNTGTNGFSGMTLRSRNSNI